MRGRRWASLTRLFHETPKGGSIGLGVAIIVALHLDHRNGDFSAFHWRVGLYLFPQRVESGKLVAWIDGMFVCRDVLSEFKSDGMIALVVEARRLVRRRGRSEVFKTGGIRCGGLQKRLFPADSRMARWRCKASFDFQIIPTIIPVRVPVGNRCG